MDGKSKTFHFAAKFLEATRSLKIRDREFQLFLVFHAKLKPRNILSAGIKKARKREVNIWKKVFVEVGARVFEPAICVNAISEKNFTSKLLPSTYVVLHFRIEHF